MQDAVQCLEVGNLEVDDVTLDAVTELESKLDFSREGDHWEPTTKPDGSLVVAVDCTQDEQTQAAGMSRELINAIQQLRKGAGLDLQDVVEVFFEEEDDAVEKAVSANVQQFEQKFRGSVPLPARFKPAYSVELKSDVADVGNGQVRVFICRPAVALSDELLAASAAEPETDVAKKASAAVKVLSTLEPSSLSSEFSFSMDGQSYTLKQGSDYWLSTAQKVRDTKAVPWMA